LRIADWLNAVGLAEYIAAFEANHIDLDQLSELTDADLKDIGVIANGMVRPCSNPVSDRSWRRAPKTRSTPCLRNLAAQSP
jgi:hypothetical protein